MSHKRTSKALALQRGGLQISDHGPPQLRIDDSRVVAEGCAEFPLEIAFDAVSRQLQKNATQTTRTYGQSAIAGCCKSASPLTGRCCDFHIPSQLRIDDSLVMAGSCEEFPLEIDARRVIRTWLRSLAKPWFLETTTAVRAEDAYRTNVFGD
jgi:hypothetical protein